MKVYVHGRGSLRANSDGREHRTLLPQMSPTKIMDCLWSSPRRRKDEDVQSVVFISEVALSIGNRVWVAFCQASPTPKVACPYSRSRQATARYVQACCLLQRLCTCRVHDLVWVLHESLVAGVYRSFAVPSRRLLATAGPCSASAENWCRSTHVG